MCDVAPLYGVFVLSCCFFCTCVHNVYIGVSSGEPALATTAPHQVGNDDNDAEFDMFAQTRQMAYTAYG